MVRGSRTEDEFKARMRDAGYEDWEIEEELEEMRLNSRGLKIDPQNERREIYADRYNKEGATLSEKNGVSSMPSKPYIPFNELPVEDQWKIANEGLPEKLAAVRDGKAIDRLMMSGCPEVLQAINDQGYRADERILDIYEARTALADKDAELYSMLRNHELWLVGDPQGKRLEATDALHGANLDGAKFNLSHAILHGDNKNVRFGDTILYGARIDGDIQGSVFSGADLTQADLTEAVCDGIIAKDCTCVYTKGLPADGEKHCVINNVYTTDQYLEDLKTKPSRGASLKEIGQMSKMASTALNASKSMSEPTAQIER